MAIALAIGLAGPGKVSLDHALGVRLPRRLILVPGLALAGASIAYGVISSKQAQSQVQEESQETAPRLAHVDAHEEVSEPVRVPEMPTGDGREPHEVLNEAGLDYLTDERIEAGESQNYPN
jgi:hypothetical protein